jgi:very-short-patch-repair endonuclease
MIKAEKKSDLLSPLPPGGGKGEGISEISVKIWRKKLPHNQNLVDRIQTLRDNPTPGEHQLWSLIEETRPEGFEFRRQHPIGSYIADFYCPVHKCVIEIDSPSPGSSQEYDLKRDRYMTQLGITVFRFTEEDAQSNPEAILETVVSHCGSSLPLTPSGE